MHHSNHLTPTMDAFHLSIGVWEIETRTAEFTWSVVHSANFCYTCNFLHFKSVNQPI